MMIQDVAGFSSLIFPIFIFSFQEKPCKKLEFLRKGWMREKINKSSKFFRRSKFRKKEVKRNEKSRKNGFSTDPCNLTVQSLTLPTNLRPQKFALVLSFLFPIFKIKYFFLKEIKREGWYFPQN